MVCTANDLIGWNDFPKGLKVLLLDEDGRSAVDMRSKLEQMDYIVSIFCNKDEALSAISSKSQTFHVAIVEVNTGNNDEIFKFLETVKDLPTIMTSNIHCLSTIMKCIALGAVEFLQKPLSDDKLRNIWQHVVHKAFNAGGKDAPESLKPVKESVVSMLELQLEKDEAHKQISIKIEDSTMVQASTLDPSSGSEKFPAPSTPQLKQGVRLVDDGDCQDQTNFSTERDSGEQDVESKFVETTCCNSVAENTGVRSPTEQLGEAEVKEEHESVDKSETNVSPCSQNKDCSENDGADPSKTSRPHTSSGSKSSRKKMKVDWTPELHKKFVHAVEQLGVDQAIPSRILEIMKVEGLTRHNVASHLQKYRMHRRHILPKESARRWPNPRESTQRSYYPQKPIMAYPPYHSNHVPPANQVYPAWIPPGSYPNGVNMWGSHYYPPWQPAENWHWMPYPGMNADAWGCPVMPAASGSCPPYPQNAYMYHNAQEMQTRGTMLQNLFDIQPAEEVIDKVVKEAINKPWLPLPLGLKPPSTECVLDELSKQGISTFPPPHINTGSHIH